MQWQQLIVKRLVPVVARTPWRVGGTCGRDWIPPPTSSHSFTPRTSWFSTQTINDLHIPPSVPNPPAPQLQYPNVISTKVTVGGRSVELCARLGVGQPDLSTVFHSTWLWSNDPQCIHPTSGQRTRSPTTAFAWKIDRANIVALSPDKTDRHPQPPIGSFHPVSTVYSLPVDSIEDNGPEQSKSLLQIVWKNKFSGKETTSWYDLQWLWQFRYDTSELDKRCQASTITPAMALKQGDELHQVDFEEWQSPSTHDATRWELLDAIFKKGAVMIKNAPTGPKETVVGAVGKSLAGGSLSHGSLYGDVFHVQSELHATNVASTTMPLPPHHDLAYYESKPGLQLLHCVNNRGVTGGSSTLIDALAAAHAFQRIAPRLFQTLTECPATFVKQRKDADMVYRRPHIEQDSQGSIIRVNWSPPFEGPLQIHPDLVEDYYLAYGCLERLLDNSLPANASLLPLPDSLEQELVRYAQEYTWDGNMEMGDILIFSNHRMLHGRRGFELSNDKETNGRHLIGCYTNLDDTLNQYRMLRRQSLVERQANGQAFYIPVTGNGSSGTQ